MESDTTETMIDLVAPLLGIQVRPEWRDAILVHLRISLAHAASVAAFPLPDEAEPAPVFRA